jgi:hypothetical protein
MTAHVRPCPHSLANPEGAQAAWRRRDGHVESPASAGRSRASPRPVPPPHLAHRLITKETTSRNIGQSLNLSVVDINSFSGSVQGCGIWPLSDSRSKVTPLPASAVFPDVSRRALPCHAGRRAMPTGSPRSGRAGCLYAHNHSEPSQRGEPDPVPSCTYLSMRCYHLLDTQRPASPAPGAGRLAWLGGPAGRAKRYCVLVEIHAAFRVRGSRECFLARLSLVSRLSEDGHRGRTE